jgi:hypothetical protein
MATQEKQAPKPKPSHPSPYRSEIVRAAYVEVIGVIWQPGTGTCAYRYELRDYDLDNMNAFTRDNVDRWLGANAGDFQAVKDFHAVCGKAEIPWKSEESECTFNDCMYPSED